MVGQHQNDARSGSIISKVFDCVLVINLADRKDRRHEIEQEICRLGLYFSDGSAEILTASRFSEPAGFETVGARGCFDSHLRALKEAQKRGARNLLILEDDCDFIKNIELHIELTLKRLENEKWSLFYGGHLSFIDTGSVSDGMLLIDPDVALQGSHFMGISGSALPVLIAYLEQMISRSAGDPLGGPMHVDGAYSWFRRAHPHLETWVAEPPLGLQRASRTDVHKLRFFDRAPGLRGVSELARRLKRKFRT